VERTGCRGLSFWVAAVVPGCVAGGGSGECAQELTGGCGKIVPVGGGTPGEFLPALAHG